VSVSRLLYSLWRNSGQGRSSFTPQRVLEWASTRVRKISLRTFVFVLSPALCVCLYFPNIVFSCDASITDPTPTIDLASSIMARDKSGIIVRPIYHRSNLLTVILSQVRYKKVRFVHIKSSLFTVIASHPPSHARHRKSPYMLALRSSITNSKYQLNSYSSVTTP
jgi:hypothetical protein